MQRTKETGISSELRASNMRVVDPAELPRGPISPNMQRGVTVAFGSAVILALGLAFFSSISTADQDARANPRRTSGCRSSGWCRRSAGGRRAARRPC